MVFSFFIIGLLYYSYKPIKLIFKENLPHNVYSMVLLFALLFVLITFFFISIILLLDRITWKRFAFPALLFLVVYLSSNYSKYFVISSAIIFWFYPLSLGDWKPNLWIYASFLIMGILFCFGTLAIDQLYGYHPFPNSIPLEDIDVRQKNFTLECGPTVSARKTLAEVRHYCRITPETEIGNIEIGFFSNQGKIKDRELKNVKYIFFTPPPKTVHTNFFLEIQTEVNETLFLFVDENYSFYTYEEHQKRQGYFITYLLALIGAIFFSVPTMIVNFKKLLSN